MMAQYAYLDCAKTSLSLPWHTAGDTIALPSIAATHCKSPPQMIMVCLSQALSNTYGHIHNTIVVLEGCSHDSTEYGPLGDVV